MRSQLAALVAAAALALVGACDKKKDAPPAPVTAKDAPQAAPATKLGDLSTSLAAVREEFNAHKGEARFLTLLSPT